jgi:signal transduction histidine kinase
MKVARLRQLRSWRKRRLPLRLRLALWSGALVLVLSFGLLLFINWVAFSSFHNIIGAKTPPPVTIQHHTRPACFSAIPFVCLSARSANPLESALIFELRNISLVGLGLVAVLGGVGAYLFAGIALRPVRRVSRAARQISANTLNTRLALEGPKDEIKELADTFDAMLERLGQTFELQNRFVADVAHELRTPLASLRTNLEVVTADGDAMLDDYRAMVATQERALTRLERLVADLLILATSEQPLVRSEVALAPLLEEMLNDLQQQANARQVTLQLIGKAEVMVPGNGQLLARAFSNLVENGIYYNHAGGEVVVTLDQKEEQALVTVADTGIGIDADKQTSIFERFYRVDCSRARHSGGAGLGLSIVGAIVQRHGGKVQVESIPGKGSTFTVLLPL